MVHEIFIIEGRRDQRPFVTSAVRRDKIRETINRHGLSEPRISHWLRCGKDPTGYQHPTDGWELQERYSA